MGHNAIPLHTPLGEADVRNLHTGDFVLLSGVMFTGRDAVHKHLHSGGEIACDLRNAAIYHCGPVTVRDGDEWRVTAAGPTTSIREEPYMPGLIERLGLRAIIGKGGMGESTLAACREHGCVYLHAVGGVAQSLARSIERVVTVHGYDQFGAPEAVWELLVRDFPAMVTMDSHGSSLHADVAARSASRLAELLRQ